MTRAKIRPLAVQKKKDGLYKIQIVKLKLNYHIISIQIGIIFNLYKNVPSIFTHNKDFLATRSSNGNRQSLVYGINDKREFVPRDHVYPLLIIDCSLSVHGNQLFYTSFIHENRFSRFCQLIFHFEKFTTQIRRLPFAVNILRVLNDLQPICE